jgi:hypothetical protein
MNVTGAFPTLICFSIALIPLVIIGIYGTRGKIRYVAFTNELRRKGKYKEWASENRILLFLEKFFPMPFLPLLLVLSLLVSSSWRMLQSSFSFASSFFACWG